MCNILLKRVERCNIYLPPFAKYMYLFQSLLAKGGLQPLHPFRVVLGWAYRGLTGGFLLLQNFCVAISVSPHVCFILVLILISMFLR